MDKAEINKSKTYILLELLEYIPNSVISRSIIRKPTGNINIIAVDTGETLAEKISPFDIFIQIIDGIAEIVMDEKSLTLHTGQAIIIPAHVSNRFIANKRFIMISTVIKSGYEGNIL